MTKGTEMETKVDQECMRGVEMKTGSITTFSREVSEGEEEWQQLKREVGSRKVLFFLNG